MNAPTLIIGLGGKGSDIALRVSDMVTAEERERISFVVFDTDVNELREIGRKSPFVKTIQTSTRLSVGEYLDIDTHSRDTWFPVNAILNSKQLAEGAGQVRAISRLAFETAIKAGKMEPLHQAIEDLYKLEGNEFEQALRVIIVSSLAGGTGSGLILQVALYVKNYLATHYRQGANITRGFFLLPEVFYGPIQGQAERNNLKCNAYATLRELDAFLMKGDSTLPERYEDSVKVEFPNVSTDTYEEYRVRPFDFCFLFDAQNCDGKKLNSFEEYLDHAASCIYAQSIGPMNKRSNSSEDNTIRKLVEESGRNRYAGAGTSMLIYPTKEVKEYLALNWAREAISEQWLTYDDEFRQRKKDIARMRRDGVRVQDIEPASNYINTVEQKANNKEPFSTAVRDACYLYDEDGFEVIGTRWEEYLDRLNKKIKDDNEFGQNGLESAKKEARNKIASLRDPETIALKKDEVWRHYIEAYDDLETYKNKAMKNVEDTAYTVAYTLFKSENDAVLSEKLPHQMETYLRDGRSGEFIHPNAIRYFLYNLNQLFLDYKQFVDNKCSDAEDFFKNFESNNFDDKATEDVIETVNDLARTKKIGIADKIRKRVSVDQEDLINAYNRYLATVDEYRVNAVMRVVLQEGLEYISELSKAFEVFFNSLRDKIATIDRQIKDIENRYDYVKGTAKRYVCASSDCLKKMLDDMPYTGSFVNIGGKLSEDIYSRIRKYAMMRNKPDPESSDDYFREIFDKGIMEYFRKSLMESYSGAVDMDIIDAIEKEAEYQEGILYNEEKQLYVKRVFDESKILAAPFIERPIGEEKSPINSCAYNDQLNPRDDSPRSMIINSELRNFGGEEDSDIPKNTIFFYKSFYGLRATDLSKFAPKEVTDTFTRSEGEYYRAYFDLIERIHPASDKSKVITPHIDKWWHNISKMPDLDDENQKRQEDAIYRAMFWGMIGNFVELIQSDDEDRIYRLRVDDLDLEGESSQLIVSNGTPCDKLYEILDAFSIYPALVKKVNEKVDFMIAQDIEFNYEIAESKMVEWLGEFRLKEYPLQENAVRSIFDLPLLIKRNMPKELYYEERIIKILRVEMNEIIKYAEAICIEKEARIEAAKIIKAQFDLFLRDIELEKEEYKKFYGDILFDRFSTIVRKTLEGLGARKEAADVKNRTDALKLQ